MPRYIPEFHHDFLYNAYVVEQKSLDDIALECQCTRPGVWKAMRRFSVPTRSRSDARRLALRQDKFTYHDSEGNVHFKQAVDFDESFFATPSPDMAWALGLFFSEGCLQQSAYKKSGNPKTLCAISQKDPEILEKLRALMKSNIRIYRNAHGLHSLSFASPLLHAQLSAWGIGQPSSTNLSFPDLPPDLIPHFIRGCFDGDGSIYCESGHDTPQAKYVSACRPFISALARQLHHLGTTLQKIHEQEYPKKNSTGTIYSFRFSGNSVAKLAEILYSDSTELNRLNRKYELFKLSAYKYGVEIN